MNQITLQELIDRSKNWFDLDVPLYVTIGGVRIPLVFACATVSGIDFDLGKAVHR